MEVRLPKAPRGGRPAPRPRKRSRVQLAPSAGAGTAQQPAPVARERPAGLGAVPRPTPSLARRGTVPVLRRHLREGAVDYAYVLLDLRRIGVIAGSLAALLVVLSFFVR